MNSYLKQARIFTLVGTATMAVAGVGAPPSQVRAADVFFASEASLSRHLGPVVDQGTIKKDGVWFRPPGFLLVYVDAPGPKMHTVSFRFDRLLTWQNALQQIGLSPAGGRPHMDALAKSALTTRRNAMTLVKLKGLPDGWTASYDELGIVDHAKLRAIKADLARLTGDARIQALRSCYDWHSVLTFKSP